MRVKVLLHQPGLPLRALCLDREQVAANPQTQLLLVHSIGGENDEPPWDEPFHKRIQRCSQFHPNQVFGFFDEDVQFSPALRLHLFSCGGDTFSNKCNSTLTWPTLWFFFYLLSRETPAFSVG